MDPIDEVRNLIIVLILEIFLMLHQESGFPQEQADHHVRDIPGVPPQEDRKTPMPGESELKIIRDSDLVHVPGMNGRVCRSQIIIRFEGLQRDARKQALRKDHDTVKSEARPLLVPLHPVRRDRGRLAEFLEVGGSELPRRMIAPVNTEAPGLPVFQEIPGRPRIRPPIVPRDEGDGRLEPLLAHQAREPLAVQETVFLLQQGIVNDEAGVLPRIMPTIIAKSMPEEHDIRQ